MKPIKIHCLGMHVAAGIGLLALASWSLSGCSGLSTPTNPNTATSEDGATTTGNDPNNSADPNNPAGPTGNDPTNSGCASDRVEAPAGNGCTCTYTSCDASQLNCTCDLSCYGGTGQCLITVDPVTGQPITGDGTLGSCTSFSCSPEDDFSQQIGCSGSNCEVQPKVIQIAPNVAPTVDVQVLDRQVRTAGMLTTIDPSGSMDSKQMNLACAVDAFINTTAGADWTMGISVMNVQNLYDGSGNYVGNAPDNIGLGSSCSIIPQCSGGCSGGGVPTCESHMTGDGTPVASSDANASTTLEQLFVIGDYRDESVYATSGYGGDEAGLEYLYRQILWLASQGRAQEISQVVAVSDEAADSDGEICTIQAKRYDAANWSPVQAIVGPSFIHPLNTGDCATDMRAFYIYFFTFYDIQVNVLINPGDDPGRVYQDTATATGGAIGNILDCSAFDQFWIDVGNSTTSISTGLCLGQAVDPSTLTVVYVDGGNQIVPQDTGNGNGWTYNASTNCIVLTGTWLDKYGSFQVEYGGSGQALPQVCFAPGVDPLIDTLQMSYQGNVVPKSDGTTDGWTFDPVTDCFTLHGTWADNPGPFDISYL